MRRRISRALGGIRMTGQLDSDGTFLQRKFGCCEFNDGQNKWAERGDMFFSEWIRWRKNGPVWRICFCISVFETLNWSNGKIPCNGGIARFSSFSFGEIAFAKMISGTFANKMSKTLSLANGTLPEESAKKTSIYKKGFRNLKFVQFAHCL